MISHNILDTILEHKRQVEVPARKRVQPPADVRRASERMATATRDFAMALRRPDRRVALIAEVKRASPSKGVLVKGAFDPAWLACTYEANGAACISVLTDEKFFQGSLDHLRDVRAAVNLPILRKDFVVDAYQLYEARAAGADAALLIVAALDDAELRDLFALAHELTLTALVEVHDERETERALAVGARVIGVNNRDLRTFVTDIATTEKCIQAVDGGPFDGYRAGWTADDGMVADRRWSVVSESGIFTPDDVRRVAAMGANAVLVGESIITSGDVAGQVRALSSVKGILPPSASE